MAEHEHEFRASKLVVREARFGHAKFGAYKSRHEAAAVVMEELDEFWAAVKHQNAYDQAEEALQVAATAFRFVLEFGDLEFLEEYLARREMWLIAESKTDDD